MTSCPSCFRESANGDLCAECAALTRSEIALPLGATLHSNRYRIGRTLGDPGGFGVTYLGWDASLERRVAIKEYLPRHLATRAPSRGTLQPLTITGEEEFHAGLRGFLEEARRLARLDHVNVVKVLDYSEANGTGYLVMSYYEGRDLFAYWRSRGGRLPWQETVALALPLLGGLAEVHRSGLIHRDIKPANIYLASVPDGSTRPILIDFGAARWASTSHELTAILTEGFSPLEQYPGCGAQGPYTDIYAMASTMYALLTGQVPPSAPSRISGAYVSHVTDLVPGVPRRLGDALEQAMAVEYAERPQTAGEFARLLRAAERPTPSRGWVAQTGEMPGDVRPGAMSERALHDSFTPVGSRYEPAPSTGRTVPLTVGEQAAPRRNRVPLVAGGAVLVAAVAWGAWTMANSRSAATVAPPSSPAPETTKVSSPDPARTKAPAPADPAVEVRPILAEATSALTNGRYSEAMASLGRAHRMLGDGSAQAASARRVDSLAAVVAKACSSERAMHVKRGENPPPCPPRSW